VREVLERLAAADSELVDLQLRIAQIAAPTGEEGHRARLVERWFRDAGLEEIETDSIGNVIGRIAGAARESRSGIVPGSARESHSGIVPGSARESHSGVAPDSPARGGDDAAPVAVCAHIDTVFPRDADLTLRWEGDRCIGPGTTDNARGVAAMLIIARELARAVSAGEVALPRPVEMVATVGEEGEGDLRGAKHYFATRGANVVAAIALDGCGDDRIIHQALGSRRFRIEFTGPGGHSWNAFGTVNPVNAVARCTAGLVRIPLPESPRCSLTVARIGGGISINSIPELAWMEVDIRSTAAAPLAELEAELRALAAAAAMEESSRRLEGTPQLDHEVIPIGDRPCGEIPPDHPLVLAAMEATRAIGREPHLGLSSTDANVPLSLGIPAISIGAGGIAGGTHTRAEWFENRDGAAGVARALQVLVAAAGLT
jgi:tripeptide aminopeptidase